VIFTGLFHFFLFFYQAQHCIRDDGVAKMVIFENGAQRTLHNPFIG
jgi:hypothetical protein